MRGGFRVDHGRMLDRLGVEVTLLVDAARHGPPEARVGGASGRTVRESVRHVGDVCEDALSWLGADEADAAGWASGDGSDVEALSRRVADRSADLLAELRRRPPDDPCPTWWPGDHTVRFWLRRALHAAVVHRADVEAAVWNTHAVVDVGLALDGIDEVLRAWLAHRLHALGVLPHGTWMTRVQAGGEGWLVAADGGGIGVHRDDEGGPVDATLSGTPQNVYLWLWGRLPDRMIMTSGDHHAIAQLWSLLRIATR